MASRELDEAVRKIAELMLAGEWEAGTSHLMFADQYGVTTHTVRTWAADASRFIRLHADVDQQEIRDELLRSIRRVGKRAEGAGDFRSANGSLELACKVHGLLERKPASDAGTEPVPVEQLAAALRKLGHEVKLNEPIRTEPASVGPTSDADTERPGPERVEGFLEGDEED